MGAFNYFCCLYSVKKPQSYVVSKAFMAYKKGDVASDPTPSIFGKNSMMTRSLMLERSGAAAFAVSVLRQTNTTLLR